MVMVTMGILAYVGVDHQGPITTVVLQIFLKFCKFLSAVRIRIVDHWTVNTKQSALYNQIV